MGNKRHTLHPGQVVRIDGPYDTYGIVQSHVHRHIWLIRGIGRVKRTDHKDLVEVY